MKNQNQNQKQKQNEFEDQNKTQEPPEPPEDFSGEDFSNFILKTKNDPRILELTEDLNKLNMSETENHKTKTTINLEKN